MTLDGFLTFLALAVAAFAIISPVSRLRLRLQSGLQLVVAGTAIGLVLYLEFFEAVSQPCPSFLGSVCSWLTFHKDGVLKPQMAAFLVILVWSILAALIWKWAPIGPRAFKPMAKLVQQLIYEQRYPELLDFIEPHLEFIEKAAGRRLRAQIWHDWICGPRPWDLASRDPSNRLADRAVRWARRGLRPLACLIPSQNVATDRADEIARAIYGTPPLTIFIARQRPTFAEHLLKRNLPHRFAFSDAFLTELIRTPDSKLYAELNDNQNLNDRGGYVISPHNRILFTLFADAKVAHTLAVWKPVGDFVIARLRSDRNQEQSTYLNGRADHFHEERWCDQIFATIFFFDIMVRAAGNQEINYHMWLYYISSILEEIESLYDETGHDIDPSDEFPTRGSYLIYEAFSALGEWINLFKYADAASPHSETPASVHTGTSGIPASAAICQADCLVHVLQSPRIGDSFAAYMLECVLRDMRGLDRSNREGAMRTFLIRALIAGGRHGASADYVQRLAKLFRGTDHVLRSEVSDFESAARAAFPNAGF